MTRHLKQMRALGGVAAATLALAGCADGFFHDPAPAGAVRIAITARQAGDGAGDAFDKADNLEIRVEDRSDGSSLYSKSIPVSAGGGPIRASFDVDLAGDVIDAHLEISVRRGSDDLFLGSADASLVPGDDRDVSVSLVPVPAGLDLPTLPEFTTYGQVVPLGGSVLFATGDVLPEAQVEWESLDPTVLVVEPAPSGGYQARAVADGAAALQATFGPQEAQVEADVRAVAVAAEIVPSSIQLAPGQSDALEVILYDAANNVIPGRTSVWTSSDEGVAVVSESGAIMATGLGQAEVTATHQAVSAMAVVTVRNPGPIVSRPSTRSLRVDGATVAVDVDPGGLPTTVWFEYGTDPDFGTFQQTAVAQIPAGAGLTEILRILEGLLDNTTYYVRAVAENALGRTVGEVLSFTTLDAPEAPSGLTAELEPDGGATLGWTDNSVGETRFEIERRVGASGTPAVIGTVGGDVTGFTDPAPPAGPIEYRVRACNASGCSPWSDPAAIAVPDVSPSVETLDPVVTTPDDVQLRAFVQPRGFASSLLFEYGTDPSLSTFTTSAVTVVGAASGPMTLARPVGGLASNETYFVRAVVLSTRGRAEGAIVSFATGDGAGPGPGEPEVPPPGAPDAPSGLIAALDGLGGVTLTWMDNSGNETGFQIEREVVSSGDRVTAPVGAGAVQYTDPAPPAGLLRYRVRSCNATGCSAWSPAVEIEVSPAPPPPPPPPPTTVPTAPSGLTALLNGADGVDLTWSDDSDDEEGFEVERETVASGDLATFPVGSGVEAWTDGAPPAGENRYRVRACNVVGCSDWTDPVTVDVPQPPVVTEPPLYVTPVAAKLRATIDNGGLDAIAYFEWGAAPDLSDAQATDPTAVGGSPAPVDFLWFLENLDPSTTYYTRVVMETAEGRFVGGIVAFTTADAPAPAP